MTKRSPGNRHTRCQSWSRTAESLASQQTECSVTRLPESSSTLARTMAEPARSAARPDRLNCPNRTQDAVRQGTESLDSKRSANSIGVSLTSHDKEAVSRPEFSETATAARRGEPTVRFRDRNHCWKKAQKCLRQVAQPIEPHSSKVRSDRQTETCGLSVRRHDLIGPEASERVR